MVCFDICHGRVGHLLNSETLHTKVVTPLLDQIEYANITTIKYFSCLCPYNLISSSVFTFVGPVIVNPMYSKPIIQIISWSYSDLWYCNDLALLQTQFVFVKNKSFTYCLISAICCKEMIPSIFETLSFVNKLIKKHFSFKSSSSWWNKTQLDRFTHLFENNALNLCFISSY